MTEGAYGKTELRFNKHSIVVVQDGYVVMKAVVRSNSVSMIFKHGGKSELSDQIVNILEQNAISYGTHKLAVKAKIKPAQVESLEEMFNAIAVINNRWWAS